MGFQAGAAAPLNYLTSLFALVRRGQAQPGEVLLVHGAAGGVGAAAIQVGRALGLTTIAVTSNERKRAFAAGCGADHAVCGANWREAVREIVGAAGVDLALDPVGGDRLVDSLRLLAPEGRLLVVGFTAGEIPTVKVIRLLLGNIGVLGAARCWGRPRASSSNGSRPSWPSCGLTTSTCARPAPWRIRRSRSGRLPTRARPCKPSNTDAASARTY